MVYNLCWVYTLSFWSTLSSHFGIGFNSVLCCGSLEHFERVISHFSKRGILKDLLGQMVKSSVWGVLSNLLQRKQSCFPGQPWVVLFPLYLLFHPWSLKPFSHDQNSSLWNAWILLRSYPEVCDSHQQSPFPCASVPENPWHHAGTATAESFNFFSVLDQSWLRKSYKIMHICLPTNML